MGSFTSTVSSRNTTLSLPLDSVRKLPTPVGYVRSDFTPFLASDLVSFGIGDLARAAGH